MKIAPSGLGMWIWQIKNCDNGNWDKIIDRCKKTGVKWLAIKCGETTRYQQFNNENAKKIVKLCHDNDIKVYVWVYSKPEVWQKEIPVLKGCIDDGADGLIINAEIEWQMAKNANQIAEQYMVELRKQVGDVFIAHAPFPIVSYHLDFPYIGFGKYMDAVMPQSYWAEIGRPVDKIVSWTNNEWVKFNQKNPQSAKPVWPIGNTYGKGPMAPKAPSVLNPEDVAKFVKAYPDLPISLYSYDACSKEVWAVLEKLYKETPGPTKTESQFSPVELEEIGIPLEIPREAVSHSEDNVDALLMKNAFNPLGFIFDLIKKLFSLFK